MIGVYHNKENDVHVSIYGTDVEHNVYNDRNIGNNIGNDEDDEKGS